MDAEALQNFAASSQPIQYSAYSDGVEGQTPQDVAAAAAGYAPADSTDANAPYDIHADEGTSPRQTRGQSHAMKAPNSADQPPHSPQQTRQTRASNGTPSRAVATAAVSTPLDVFQGQQDPSQTQNQGELVWKHSSSVFPTGTPNLSTRSQSKQAFGAPHGLVRADPWSSHHNPAPQPNTPTSTSNDQDNASAIETTPLAGNLSLIATPPDLDAWRQKLFNVTDTLVLSEEEYLTYFPHVDNVYSHRSTQKYKRKPFVSHYWDCRLKGRPSGTPKSDDPNKKKRKRQARERDLCDVKIKVTEYFSADEAQRLGMNAPGSDAGGMNGTVGIGATDPALTDNSELMIVLEDGVNGNGTANVGSSTSNDPNFGLLELPRRLPTGHPGAEGKRWFTIQRVRGNPGGGAVKDKRNSSAGGLGEGEEDVDESTLLDSGMDLDHKHTLEESDRIKKNSVQRWILKEEKEKKRQSKPPTPATTIMTSSHSESTSPSFRASGMAFFTARSHAGPAPSKVTFYANSFCPFAQRIWIALEIKGVPYQMVEVLPAHMDPYRPPELVEVNPEGHIPCVRHGNWAIWESGVVLEYLEDLDMGHSLLPLGNPQLRAHCRLWTDHINRKILPSFYSLLLTPPPQEHRDRDGDGDPSDGDIDIDMDLNGTGQATAATEEQHSMLIATLQRNITLLVNASHATGPFFLGNEISFVDVVFAPWIIRLSRVLSYYRHFPRPEIGTRWRRWVDAIEADDRVKRTISEENSYHGVYRGVGEDGWDSLVRKDEYDQFKPIVEIQYAKRVVQQEGFGLGGDVWGRLREEDMAHEQRSMAI